MMAIDSDLSYNPACEVFLLLQRRPPSPPEDTLGQGSWRGGAR